MAALVLNDQAVFEEARKIDSREARDRYLKQACAQDPDLEQRVRALLAAYQDHASFLEKPALDSAAAYGPTVFQRPIAETPGTVIGHYKLLEQIGEGGFGNVFMAEQTAPVRRMVALKVIKPGMDSRQVIARFEAERQALALMDHPNIARVLDAGATPHGRPFFVMELVRGVPITTYCDQRQLSPRERLELFITVCQAVQHAHQKGIIHRDIKPTNVLVTQHDDRPVVKVIDFGVAKAMSGQLTDKTLFTGFTQMIGTPLYMSPEQTEMSALGVDTRSDIYSLGVLLYELLTGSTPLSHKRIEDAGFHEILRMIREEEPPKPSTRLAQSADTLLSISAQRHMEPAKLTKLMRGELDWIVMKTLEKDRSRRYETASAFAADVQRYLRDETVEACPPSAWYRFRKFVRRNKRGLLTASAVALAALLTATVSGVLIWQSINRERSGAYYERIALAEREWGANNLSRMQELLDQCPEDLRGWEWHYLKRLPYGVPAPLRHESPVYSVAFSANNRYLATATKDGVITLWRAEAGVEIRSWRAHEANATCLDFSPDGRFLASGGWDSQIKLWDVERALQSEPITPALQFEHPGQIRVWSVAFSPDSRQLATGGGRTAEQTGEIRIWDLQTKQAKFAFTDFSNSIRSVQFSPDGRYLATAGLEGLVQLWDAQAGQEVRTFDGNIPAASDVAFSPDGRRLAVVAGHISVYPDQDVKVWDTRTGAELLSMHGHTGGLQSVAFSPDGRRIASAGLDQTVKVWDAESGETVLTLRGHLGNIFCVTFSPDGRRLASASIDRTVRIWDAASPGPHSGPECLTLSGHTGAVTDVAFQPTGGHILASADTDGTIRTWNFTTGELLGSLPGDASGARLRVTYSPDGKRIAMVNGNPPEVSVWDIETANRICTFSNRSDPINCAVFSPDGTHVASAGYDFTVRIWDAETAEPTQTLAGHDWPIFDVAYSPDGQQLVSCSGDNTVRVWDLRSGVETVLEPMHAARVMDVEYCRDGTRLASTSLDRTIKVWDTADWHLVRDLQDSTGSVQCVAFGPDRTRMLWGSTDGTVKVWDEGVADPQVLRGHTSWIEAVAFSPDGEWIASASLDGTVKIWKAPPEPEATVAETTEQ